MAPGAISAPLRPAARISTQADGLRLRKRLAPSGVVTMSEGWQQQLAPKGIGVSVLCPGLVSTNIYAGRRNRQHTTYGEKDKDFGSWTPSDDKQKHSLDAGGRHYVTCIGLLQLTVYYRYLPVYRVLEDEKAVAAAER